jgi:segregation and condensation protein A
MLHLDSAHDAPSPAIRRPSPLTAEAVSPRKEAPLDGIDLLVHLAKTGQLDPWNVDIVAVADKYLQAVEAIKASDLKITGKTLLYLAILLRMKSDHLAGTNYLDPPDENEFFESLMEDVDPDALANAPVRSRLTVRSLDEVLQRRTSTKQPRIRPVTLSDLIQELRKVEALESRRALEDRFKRSDARREMRDYVNLTADDIEDLAHEEFQEDTIETLYQLLTQAPLANQSPISLRQLEAASQLDRISIFLSLLFLSARGLVQLEQATFYGELHVSVVNQTPLTPALH